MNLQTQLEASDDSKHIIVVEIVPPTVTTDFHRERSNPNDNKKENKPDTLSLKELMDEVVHGWKANLDVIAPGSASSVTSKWYDTSGRIYEDAAVDLKKS